MRIRLPLMIGCFLLVLGGVLGCEATSLPSSTLTTSSSPPTSITSVTAPPSSTSTIVPPAMPSLKSFELDPSCVPTSIQPDRSRLSEDPFGTTDEGNLGDAIKAYYANLPIPKRDVFLSPDTVCVLVATFHNPDNVLIDALKIDGVVHEADAFLEGSTQASIRIAYQAPAETGIAIVRLEEASFHAGETAHKMLFESVELRIGVVSGSIPTIVLDDYVVESTKLSFSAVASDPDDTALFRVAVLYDGNRESIRVLPLETGENHLEFSKLIPTKTYQLAFLSVYDPYAHPTLYYAFFDSFVVSTPSPYESVDLEAGHQDVSFTLEVMDPLFDEQDFTVSLWDQDVMVRSIDNPSSIAWDGLFSDREYRIRIHANVESCGETRSISVFETTFRTLAYAIPEVSLDTTIATFDALTLTFSTDDTEGIGRILAIGLADASGWVDWTNPALQAEFANLAEDTRYVVHLDYAFDLNDGIGERHRVFEWTLRTPAKDGPSVTWETEPEVSSTVAFSLSMGPYPAPYQVQAIELWESGERVFRWNEAERYSVTGLGSDRDYMVKVVLSVSFRDLSGSWTHTVELPFHTTEAVLAMPSWLGETDPFGFSDIAWDGPLEILGFELIQRDDVVAFDWSVFPLTRLAPLTETTLSIRVRCYDPEHDAIVEDVLRWTRATPEYSLPSWNEPETTASFDTIDYAFQFNDPFFTLLALSVSLWDGETVVQTANVPAGRFESLWTGHEYRLVVCAVYDLRNGSGEQELCQSQSVLTVTHDLPEFSNTALEAQTFSIFAAYAETDPNGLGSIRSIEVWKDGVLVQSVSNLWSANFKMLTHLTDYVIEATYAYDLLDGEGEHLIRTEHAVSTLPKEMPVVFFNIHFIGYDEIYASIDFYDRDEVATIVGTRIERGDDLYETYDARTLEFALNGLYSNEAIRFVVTYTVDLDDGNPIQTLTYVQTVTTLAKILPYVTGSLEQESDSFFVIDFRSMDPTESITRVEVFCQKESYCTISSYRDLVQYVRYPGVANYTIPIRVYYDLNDGLGERLRTIDLPIRLHT